jgi:hypothetical protein
MSTVENLLKGMDMQRLFSSRRYLSATILGLVALFVFAVPAGAGVSWCRADPIVELNGKRVQIWVAVPEQYVDKVTGPIDVQINVPSSVSRELIFTDAGFNGYGEKVTFTTNGGGLMPDGSFWMTVIVRVPMNGFWQSVPVQVEVVHPNGEKQYFYGSQYAVTGTFVVK